jgi:hypothetical protein
VKDPHLALSLAVARATQEGVRMIIWHDPQAARPFERYIVRPGDGVPPRTYDDRGRRISWSIWNVVEPGETTLTHQRVITPDRYW